jgi:hypothetical protein
VPQLQRTIAAERGLQSVPVYFLTVSRSGETPALQAQGRRVALRLSRSFAESYPFYRCDVQDAAGRTVMSSVVAAPPREDAGLEGELQILLDTEALRPGDYVLELGGLESSSARTPVKSARYRFALR